MKVVYELTSDKRMLGQYYRIREESYRRILGLADYNGSEESDDLNGRIFIARIGDVCIGGVRIYGSEDDKLPLDFKRDDLHQKLPELSLDKNDYCQWMRFTLCPDVDVPKLDIQRDFAVALLKCCADLGYRYGFSLSSKAHHRLYKRFVNRHGYDYWGCEKVSIATEDKFDDLEHLLYVTDLIPNTEPEENNNHTEMKVNYELDINEPSQYYCRTQ